MSNRIKRGIRKARKEKGQNPKWLSSMMTGIFPAANIPMIKSEYRSMTPQQRQATSALVRTFSGALSPEGSAIAEVFLRALDKSVESD